jgi:hypothetical protein
MARRATVTRSAAETRRAVSRAYACFITCTLENTRDVALMAIAPTSSPVSPQPPWPGTGRA